MSESSWRSFHFDGNLGWGLMRTPEDWEKILESYKDQGGLDTLRRAQADTSRKVISFGFTVCHREKLTLGEWAEQSGVDLTLGGKYS